MVRVSSISIGEGRPKICASITEQDRKAVIASADILVQKSVDIVEWRLDFYKDVEDWDMVRDTLSRLKMSSGQKPLLVTFRSKGEGGNREIDRDAYRTLLLQTAQSGHADMIDLEVYKDQPFGQERECYEQERQLIEELRKNVLVVGSYHDFNGTPSCDEMEERLRLISELGADIPKLAVMAQSRRDAIDLMSVTLKMSEELAKPLITISMGGLGVITRLAGECFGSAISFGCVGQSSAPGQVAVDRMEETLELIHQCYR